jgi:hypothetical protein
MKRWHLGREVLAQVLQLDLLTLDLRCKMLVADVSKTESSDGPHRGTHFDYLRARA